MSRWDTSPECRALIDRNHAAMLREQEERVRYPEWQIQEINVNHWWHARNLDMLERCVAYAEHDQVDAFFTLRHALAQEECARLQDKLSIMKRYKIECLPSPHMQREQALWEILREVFRGKGIEL